MRKLGKGIYSFFNILFSESVFIHASSLSFNILFVVIPMILLLFSIGSIFLDIRRSLVTQILQFVKEQLPFLEPFARKNLEILVARGKWLGLASVLILLWTTSRLFLNFRIVLFDIFSLERPKNVVLYKLKEMASVGVLAFLLLLFVFFNSLTLSLQVYIEHFKFSILAVPLFRETLYIIYTFIMVLFIYFSVIGNKIPFKTIAYGAGIISIFLELMKLLFKVFIVYAWKGKTIYGSLWVFLAFFIWIYYSTLAFVAGSEIASIMRGHK
jgi:YihY family inner membrane protein